MTTSTVPTSAAPTSTPVDVATLNSGGVVLVWQDGGEPKPYYFEGLTNSGTSFSGYSLNETLGLARYAQDVPTAHILEEISTDYYAFQRTHKYAFSKGSFIKVPVTNLPAEFRQAAEALTGHAPDRYYTWGEVLNVAKAGAGYTATLRVFTHNTDSPEGREYGTVEIPDFQNWSVDIVSAELFNNNFALASSHWTPGKLYYIDAELYRCESVAGLSGSFVPLDEATGEPATGGTLNRLSEQHAGVVFAAEDTAEYLASLPSAEVQESLMILSRNTVTRALKHADSNDYCSETAVALTSAGHQLPELVVKGTITIDIDVRSKEYMLLRKLFGRGNSDMSNVSEVLQKHWGQLADRIPGMPNRLPEGAKLDLNADIE